MTSSASPAHHQTLTAARRSVVFALVGAGHIMSHVYILTLPPLFALIKHELDVSFAALGLMVTMFHVATGVMQVPAGFLVDYFGARLTLIIGMVLSATCMGAVGAVDAYWVMVALTTLAGIGNSVFHPADYAILAAAVDERHLGKAFGFHLLAGNLGFAVAPVMMVSLAVLWDWRTAVMTVGAAGVTVGLCMLAFGRDLHAGTEPRRNATEPSSATGTRALASPALLMMLAFFILLALANAGVQTFSVTALNAAYGTDLGVANTALTFYLASGFVGVAVGGFVADRLQRPVIVVVGAMAVCAACLAVVGWTALPAVALFPAMGIGGAAIGLMRPARDMMVNAITPAGATGKAFGFVGTGLSVGGAVAPVAFGWLIDVGAAGWVFMLCAGFVVLSIAAALAVERLARRVNQVAPVEAAAE